MKKVVLTALAAAIVSTGAIADSQYPGNYPDGLTNKAKGILKVQVEVPNLIEVTGLPETTIDLINGLDNTIGDGVGKGMSRAQEIKFTVARSGASSTTGRPFSIVLEGASYAQNPKIFNMKHKTSEDALPLFAMMSFGGSGHSMSPGDPKEFTSHELIGSTVKNASLDFWVKNSDVVKAVNGKYSARLTLRATAK